MAKVQRNQKIFIAFTGPDTKQRDAVYLIQRGYECWNLKKLSAEQFVAKLKRKIPPLNTNVERNYLVDSKRGDLFGITKNEYKKCSWGLLMPNKIPDSLVNSYSEISFLMNLYSPNFMYPVFHASDFGIMTLNHEEEKMTYFHKQNRLKDFRSKKFVSFYEKLAPVSIYATWQLDRCRNWDKEDWRFFVAVLTYTSLAKYENKKYQFTWQRESADMAMLLETLLTAGDSIQVELVYRLKKRISALIGFEFGDIEKDIGELYSSRSSYVHGGIFEQISKDNRRNPENTPLPNFNLLYRQKEYVRFLLIANLNLHVLLKQGVDFSEIAKVIDMIEESVIDIKLRKQVEKETRAIFRLVPKSPIFNQ